MKNRYKPEQKLSEILNKFKGEKHVKRGIDEALIIESWNNCMGKFIIKYTDRVYYAGDTLYVKLSSAALRQELMTHSEQIKEKLNKDLGRELINKVILR